MNQTPTNTAFTFFDRDRSWLKFNRRVMEEAMDVRRVPLLERLRFLAIYSNNLDEFYATRVAFLQRVSRLSKRKQRLVDSGNVATLLDEILTETKALNRVFEQTYNTIIRELRKVNISIVNERHLTITQQNYVREFYQQHLRTQITPVMMGNSERMPLLRSNAIYLAVVLRNETTSNYAIIEAPQDIGRFCSLPTRGSRHAVILIDDIIRFNLSEIFTLVDHTSSSAYTFKISRDAELDFNDDIAFGVLENVNNTLKQRQIGMPVRLVYDEQMPEDLLKFLLQHFKSYDLENIVPGMRYHNFRDFMTFPDFGDKSLLYQPLPEHPVTTLSICSSLLASIERNDVLLAYPYHSFDNLVHIIQEAAIASSVTSIFVTFYRLADESKIALALMRAADNGKRVVAVVELKARFDEERNIEWAERLADAGLEVHFGFPNYKIHTKLILIERTIGQRKRYISHIGTGNFNEDSARVYQDVSIWTADQQIGKEVYQVFQFLVVNPFMPGEYKNLLVSPINLRQRLERMITREIAIARRGGVARIYIKVNNITDSRIISRLYEASNAGVKIRIIARSNLCLIPGIPNQSENIEVIRLIDRLLEHARVYWFSNNRRNDIFIGSADLMTRNLDNRVEVLVKVLDPRVRKQIRDMFNIQWRDTLKAREITNDFQDKQRSPSRPTQFAENRSQYALSHYFASKTVKKPRVSKITNKPKDKRLGA